MDPDRLSALLRQLQGALGGRSLRGGKAVLTFPGGSPNSGATTVTHNMGRVPSVTFGPIAGATPVVPFVVAGSETTTSFQIGGRMSDGSSPGAGGTQGVYWMAFG